MIVPGLGLTRYVRRLREEVRRRGSVATVLDVPGYGSASSRRTAPEIGAIADAVAAWVRQRAADHRRPLVLVGHSTGAQAALRAALQIQQWRDDASVVLAGPTFAPGQRTLAGLLLRAPVAYRHDPPWELDPLQLLRAGPRDLLALIRSGQRDRPELRVRELRLPLTLTAGIHDALAPRGWLELLRSNAIASRRAHVVVLGGSHNNPWTHPAQLASVVRSADLTLR
ncbi:MAG: alpha/beta fold hydrolase [Intrasporangium sp.]|uniref:alpha/beta fold hydrolase n=1 Tax=Intrasporangium sp. TaxID=1925024 RepID=UPI003F7E42CB